MSLRRLRTSIVSAALCLWAAPAWAVVKLPAILSDHMVLQRAAHVPVWGWAAPREAVSVKFGTQARSVRADEAGHWQVDLDLAAAPSTPLAMQVDGEGNTLVVNDVLVGEVWLASGQSNMEKPLGDKQGQQPTFDAEAEIAAANHPALRLFKVSKKKAAQPQDDVAGQWVVCTPASIDAIKFSAAAYYFGRTIGAALATPVGLIDSTWGGTRIEPWTPGAAPNGAIFNGMVAGLAPFALRGVLWYQGESNLIDAEDPALYTPKMEALVASWRGLWKSGFPFYYVQIAPHLYSVVRSATVKDPHMEARMWEAQTQALRIPGTGMVVTTDLVDNPRDIHPRDKKSVGLRLAKLALSDTYGRRELVAYGPVFRGLRVEGARAVLSFDFADGLAARDGRALDWFELAGADGVYHPARATIENGCVVVASAEVAVPATVRFAWSEAAQPNLVNGAGLPALPFRSDHPIPPIRKPGDAR